jgi:peptide deformylase
MKAAEATISPDALLKVPDERLRQACASVNEAEYGREHLYSWIERLDQARRPYVSIGIAGPQIGLMQRLIVIEIPAKDWLVFGPVEPVPLHALVNPEIVWSSDETIKAVESCLSIPFYQGFVSRPRRIGVVAHTPEGTRTEFEADGIYARCLQHEIDHLDGVLYPDRVSSLRDIQKIEPVEAGDALLSRNLYNIQRAEPSRVEHKSSSAKV